MAACNTHFAPRLGGSGPGPGRPCGRFGFANKKARPETNGKNTRIATEFHRNNPCGNLG